MAKRTHKNCKHLFDLLEAADLPALHILGEAKPFDFLATLDATLDGPAFREAAGIVLGELPREAVVKADQEAVRILPLADWRGEELLNFAESTWVFQRSTQEDYDPQRDLLSRLIWFWARLPTVFDQIETAYLAHHYHGHKKFKPFKIKDGDHRPFVWSEAIEAQLQTQIGEVLALEDEGRRNCEIIHFEMEDLADTDGATPRPLHYVVVYHPGKMKTLRQMKESRRDILAFFPALEATLVYDPAENKIMVLADKLATRLALAESFAEIGLDCPLSAEPLEELNYELAHFQQPVDLKQPTLKGCRILNAWVSAMTLSLGHTSHRIQITLSDNADVWAVIDNQFGTSNPLTRARSIYELKLCFELRFDDEEVTRPLDISITFKTCSLWSLKDPKLRTIGEDILIGLGLMQRVETLPTTTDMSGFLAELQLLDQHETSVEGFLLRELQLDVPALEAQGLLRKQALGDHITRLIEEDDGAVGYQRLEVQQDSRRTWAVDPLSGADIDLTESDLRRYAINKVWLRERLVNHLADQLSGAPSEPDTKEPYFLGFYPFGDQALPIHLVTGLWHAQHAAAMDIELRKQGLGIGAVLTTTTRHHPPFLGSSRVIPLAALLLDTPDGVMVDLGRIEPDIRRWLRLGESVEQPQLLLEPGGAVLIGPWPTPWTLTKPEQIAIVQVLVKAWLSGKRKCSNEEALADYEGVRRLPERFRGSDEWKTYIRSAEGKQRSRFWELNIGQPSYALENSPS